MVTLHNHQCLQGMEAAETYENKMNQGLFEQKTLGTSFGIVESSLAKIHFA